MLKYGSRFEDRPGDGADAARLEWRHVAGFLGVTFALTWLVDLAIDLHGGLETPGVVSVIQLQMLVPACSAIVLGWRLFPENSLYYRRSLGRARWFYYYVLVLTAVYVIGSAGIFVAPPGSTQLEVAATLPQVLAFLGVPVLIAVRLMAGREGMARVGLAWGVPRDYLLYGLAFVGFYVLQVVLNAIFGLGPTRPAPALPQSGPGPEVLVVLAGIESVLLAPILAIVLAFGEEYGWRGYLQAEICKLGRVRGVLIVGVIWGIWHWPLILMGWSYPGYPLMGLLLTVLFTIALAVALGYVVFRTGSILLAAYLHALNDQVTGFLVFLGFKPFDPVFSFGVGIYGVVVLAGIVVLILRDPVWHGRAPAKVQVPPAASPIC